MADNLTELLQSALKCVDRQDINREFSDAQMRHGKDMAFKATQYSRSE